MSRIKKFLPVFGAVATGAVAAGVSAFAATRVAEARPRLYRTKFGTARVFSTVTPDEVKRPIRVLSLGGGWQTVMYEDAPDEPAAAYARAFDLVLDPKVAPQPARVLVIGGAGCAWPRHAVVADPDAAVLVSEIDPAMVDIALREFRLGYAIADAGDLPDGTPRLEVRAQEGMDLLGELARQRVADPEAVPRFTAIIDDAFVGKTADDALTSPHGLELVQMNLTMFGVFVVNVSVPKDDPSALLACRDRLAAAFPFVACVPAIDAVLAEEENYLLVASHQAVKLPNAVEL